MKKFSVPTRIIQPVRTHLVPILKEALEACVDRHAIAAGRGVDSFSFGTDAWSLPTHLFQEAANQALIPFEYHGPGCVLQAGDIGVRHYRVGWSEQDDIYKSFPNNASALGDDANKNQISIFELLEDYKEIELQGRDLALAFMANPNDGLCAVYITTVGRVEDGKIVEWDDAIEIWRRDSTAIPPIGAKKPLPPPEHSPDPSVRRRKSEKKKKDFDDR